MRPYSNKTDKTDSRKCTYSEIRGNSKARKVAARRLGKDNVKLAQILS